ncbi:MAG TPA: hypothetical protein DGP89_06360 [Saprospirales bacterium]|jgi:hypothetical protein|nr:hypothetical protein [Alphaproteobacteria bacterium]HCV50952.1 hypothetical protein [Saprospirales bacterium]|tara:strand:+ start:326 stop:511 length:186 start_codon:yes stop_codon:yes gene_type:complete
MASDDDEGKMELSLRVLGNELIGFKMMVDDFKMKWVIVGLVTIIGLGWVISSFGPLIATLL